MKEKLKKLIKDKLARDILTFFYQNQRRVDSARGVAAWVHEERNVVQSLLEKLADLGVIQKDASGRTKGYCYTRDEKSMKIVEGLLKDV